MKPTSSRHQSLRWVYLPEIKTLGKGAFAFLDGAKLKHLRSVLRMEWGDALYALDGEGRAFQATLEKSTDRGGVRLAEVVREEPRPQHCELAIGFPKNKTMDVVVEKATECGVTALRPVVTSRSIVIPPADEIHKYARRWSLIAAEALEQSQQLWLPKILDPQSWNDFLVRSDRAGQQFLFASEGRDTGSLAQSFQNLKNGAAQGGVSLFIGPEGGFSAEERGQLGKIGYTELSLGPSILRVETAVIAALTLAQAALGR